MKRCELCTSLAMIYCDSDKASLCWGCDAKVHSANFLVAKHSRCLLCHSCQSPTQWSAIGEKLEPSTVSICESCVRDGTFDDGDGTCTDDDEDYDVDNDELDLEDKEVIDENQVVPWSSTRPPPATSSSNSDEYSIAGRGVSVKRRRQNIPDLSFEDDLICSSVETNHRTPPSAVTEAAIGGDKAAEIQPSSPSSESMMEKLNRNRKRNRISGGNTSATVSKTTRGVGFDLNL